VADAATEHHLIDRPTRIWILRVARVIVWVIYLFVLIALVLLIIAFFLRLFGANPNSGFAEWIYRSVDRIMQPFRGIFPTEQLSSNSVLDYSLLFAIIMYSIFALVAHWIVDLVSRHLSRLTHPRGQAFYVAAPPPTVGPYPPGAISAPYPPAGPAPAPQPPAAAPGPGQPPYPPAAPPA
jgi:uncharacterized protein YggT (Ycf19 family)